MNDKTLAIHVTEISEVNISDELEAQHAADVAAMARDNMTVRELVKTLQFTIDSRKHLFKICHTHDEFHTTVAQLVEPLLPEPLEFSVWRIRVKGEYQDGEVIEYDREFKKYSYCKHTERGNFGRVWFTAKPGMADFKISELKSVAAVRCLDRQIADAKTSIKYHEKNLEEAKSRLAKLMAEHGDAIIKYRNK